MSEMKDMSVEELLPLAERGNAEAQWRMGDCYMRRRGVPQDLTLGAEWYRKAAKQNNAWAEMLLAECYANGWGVDKDYALAAGWYRKSAEQGCSAAELKLLELQEEMDLLARAEQGDSTAQFQIGYKYANGRGVPQDYARGVEWLRKAAQQNEPNAQWELGLCYGRGHGVPYDPAQAEEWYRKAVQNGYPIPEEQT